MCFKKAFLFCLLLPLVPALWAQQKYALVIGNGNYTSFGSLANTINDANDMTAALETLGFTVDKILDGNRAQMIEGVTRLRNRLSVSSNSYGFVFYAGHGLQYNGVNYLIPANADIPNANYLGDMAISVQSMLAELNEAGNALNVVVLDACRDFPAVWSRSMNRGLGVITNQPADSIIVFATSAGSTASDGTGRNGLFTSQLLKNLAIPSLEVVEVFRRTGADVSEASNRQQIPAVYNQFFGIAYLGEAGARAAESIPLQPPPAKTQVEPAARSNQGINKESVYAIGLQAGIQISSFVSISDTDSRTNAFYISLFGSYRFTSLLSLQTGLGISFDNGANYNYNDGNVKESNEARFTVLDIPLLAAVTFYPAQNLLIRVKGGPLFSFVLTDIKNKYTYTDQVTSYDQTDNIEVSGINRFSIGFLVGAGIGYPLGPGNLVLDIQFFANYLQKNGTNLGRLTDHFGLPLILVGYEYRF